MDTIIQLGPHLKVSSVKQAACNDVSFSKYTTDLVVAVFGVDVLQTHVLKGIGKCTKPVLDKNIVDDIVGMNNNIT